MSSRQRAGTLGDETVTSREAVKDEGADPAGRDPFLLYDGECPFCSFYVAKSQFETRVGKPLRLIDGREAPDLVSRLRREGYDLEEGMILEFEGRRYHGASAMTALRAMSTGRGRFNALARWIASSPVRAGLLYPWLRRLRRAALLVKGTPRFR